MVLADFGAVAASTGEGTTFVLGIRGEALGGAGLGMGPGGDGVEKGDVLSSFWPSDWLGPVEAAR